MFEVALFCVALAVTREAGHQEPIYQMDVAHIILNRVIDPRWPNTACEVVYERGTTPNGEPSCAFSWYCDGKPDGPFDMVVFEEIKARVSAILGVYRYDPTNGATHFHSRMRRLPYWVSRLEPMGQRGPFWHYR